MTITDRNIGKTSQQTVCTSIQLDKERGVKHLLVDAKQELQPSPTSLVTASTTTIAAEDESCIKGQVMNLAKTAAVCSKGEGRVDSFDHVTFWVGNAKQSAVFYMTQFGFEPFAFRGLETGFRDHACHVVKLNDTIIQFVSACAPNNKEINSFLLSHGDAVKDVAFRVENIEALLKHAVEQGAELISPLETELFNRENANQSSLTKYFVKRATIKTFGDVTHTFIERNFEYDGDTFLPGYNKPALEVS